MPIPTFMYVASASQALPLIAGLRHGRRMPAARRWILLAVFLGLVTDAVSLRLALQKVNNLWVGYVSAPLLVVLFIIGLSCWQTDRRLRDLLRAVAGIFAVVVLALIAFVEDLSRYSLVRRPLESMLVVILALVTLLVLTRNEQGALSQRDWFWICCGLTVRYGTAIAMDPAIRAVIGSSPEAAMTALMIRQGANIVAYVLIAGGILCPVTPRRPFSGRTSPVLSAS